MLRTTLLLVCMVILSSCDDQGTPFDMSGTWTGSAEGLSDIPEDPDVDITLILRQSGTQIAGTFDTNISNPDSLSSGEVIGNRVTFTIHYPLDRITYSFSATVNYPKMAGLYTIVDDSTDVVYRQDEWFVQRR